MPSSRRPTSPSAVRRVDGSESFKVSQVRREVAVARIVHARSSECAAASFHAFEAVERFFQRARRRRVVQSGANRDDAPKVVAFRWRRSMHEPSLPSASARSGSALRQGLRCWATSASRQTGSSTGTSINWNRVRCGRGSRGTGSAPPGLPIRRASLIPGTMARVAQDKAQTTRLRLDPRGVQIALSSVPMCMPERNRCVPLLRAPSARGQEAT